MAAQPKDVVSRRELGAVVGVLVAGGTLALVVAQATWLHLDSRGSHISATLGTDFATVVSLDVKGSDAVPLVVPLAVLALAGAVGLLATRGLPRRVVGALLGLAGLGLAVSSIALAVHPTSVIPDELRRQSLDASLAPGLGTSASWWWPVLAALGGLLVVTGGSLALLHSARWPAMGARFDAPVGASAAGPAAEGLEYGDAWSALDRGEDPTADEQTGAPGPGRDLPE